MNHDAIRAGVDQLWSDLEAHHAPSITEGDLKTLRALDDAAIDGTLTEARFERTRARLLNRPRSYKVDHATGHVDPNFWAATVSTGGTNLTRRKSIIGKKHFTRQGRFHRVTIGTGENREVRDFAKAADAHLWRDCEIERRKTDAALRKAGSQDPYRDVEQARILTEAKTRSDERKAALREAMKPCPETGKVPCLSAVLRSPEFDLSGEPREGGPRPQKSGSFAA